MCKHDNSKHIINYCAWQTVTEEYFVIFSLNERVNNAKTRVFFQSKS